MKGEYLYKNDTITAVCALLMTVSSVLLYHFYGGAAEIVGILLWLPIIYRLNESKAAFSTNSKGIVFKSRISKRTINFADIYDTSCRVINCGARGYVNYYIVLTVTLKNGKKHIIKSPLAISSYTVLNDRKEYENKVRSHCLSRLNEYIGSKIHCDVRI